MQHQLLIYTLLSISIVCLIIVLQSKQKKRKGKRIQSQGIQAEEQALLTLKHQGFKLLDRHPKAHSHISISKEKYEIYATPDLLMKRGGKKWIFEVKSQNAANIHKADVRRQLREYAALYPNHKLAFFDGNTQEWEEVTFPSEPNPLLKVLISTILVVGIILGVFLERHFISNFF